MVVHLATNASLMNGTETFQRAVYIIHSPGMLLPLIEWTLIFLPLIFHAGIGVWIAKTGRSNASIYRFSNNRRYTFQRWTGFIGLVFLFFHILHLHGWSHSELWLGIIHPLGFGAFRPYNATSTLAQAMDGWIWPAFYLIGVMSLVYHLANGLWTAGITWGLWISPAAQLRASKVCTAFGVVLAVVAATAWWAAVSLRTEDLAEIRKIEDRMYRIGVEAGLVSEMPEKRSVVLESEVLEGDALNKDAAP